MIPSFLGWIQFFSSTEISSCHLLVMGRVKFVKLFGALCLSTNKALTVKGCLIGLKQVLVQSGALIVP